MQTKRENSYDLLRVVCAIGVISIHVSALWLTANTLTANTDATIMGALYQKHLLYTCLWNVLPRFAVPCFMMMSGALIIPEEQNKDFVHFYKKQFRRIGKPGVIFVTIYMLYGFAVGGASILLKHNSISRLWQPIWVAICGSNHLWYLYAMASVYALAPIVIRLKRDIGETCFAKATWFFLTLASIGYETSTNLFSWDIGSSFRYPGYFMAGYEIRSMIRGRKNNGAGALLILAGGIECVVAYVRFLQEKAGIGEANLSFPVSGPLCPWIVAASVCIFSGFSLLNVRHAYSVIAGRTFLIYLVHEGIWEILARMIKRIVAYADNRILIPLSTIGVFMISFAIAYWIHRWELRVRREKYK